MRSRRAVLVPSSSRSSSETRRRSSVWACTTSWLLSLLVWRRRISGSAALGRGARSFVRRVDPKTALEGRRIDAQNTDRLRQILAEHGWPGQSLVGEQGAHDAWLIAQHADDDPAFQRQALELLAEAVAHGEAKPRDLAYLTDRLRVNEGREQVFRHSNEAGWRWAAGSGADRGTRAPR